MWSALLPLLLLKAMALADLDCMSFLAMRGAAAIDFGAEVEPGVDVSTGTAVSSSALLSSSSELSSVGVFFSLVAAAAAFVVEIVAVMGPTLATLL